MSKNTKEDNLENSHMLNYIDSEYLDFENEQKILMENVMKSSAELETIGIIAKDLNHNIEVTYFIIK
jgi:hypothetical protein